MNKPQTGKAVQDMTRKQTETNTQRKVKSPINKFRNSLGFTMAELLIVVAIIGVLSTVSFVAVQTHQKNLSQAELDSIAKQIYVAAQNHLIMAENENYLGSTEFGTEVDASKGIYCFTNEGFSPNNNLLDQMLPFGALDETVRAGSHYIIYYQPESATVLDVFYTKDSYTFDGTTRANFGGSGNKNKRRDNVPMMGWYGGYVNGSDDAAEGVADLRQGSWLNEPTIVIENGEKLKVIVNDPYSGVAEEGYTFMLVVSGLDLDGKETGAKAAIPLANSEDRVSSTSGGYEVILDDITTEGLHFKDLATGTMYDFVVGQDISVQAVAYYPDKLSNIASSNVEITNSLFESISKDDSGVISASITASINNIRHLENLEEDISGLEYERSIGTGLDKFTLEKAIQTSDMSWELFKKNVGNDTATYMPVSPSYVLDYDGKNYNISDITVNYDGNAGLFGTMASGSKVSNLALIDFDIKTLEASTGNAGALAGSITGTDVTNVLAYNKNTSATATNVTAENGSAGGLIGSMSGGTVNKCAAALIVNGKDAGGLIGTATNSATMSGSYSGGHTTDALYTGTWDADTHTASNFNVAATGDAGGLIGKTENTTITHCYSTCSAAGAIAGGLVGEATGSISGSYVTGLVRSTAATPVEGAFAGKHESGTLSDNYYFEIINERQETDGGFSYLTALGQGQSDSGITAIDETAATYNAFCWGEVDDCPWKNAMVYDKKLIEYYGVPGDSGRNARYSLKTVEQLGATVQDEVKDEITGEVTKPADYVITHYGDWPAPEIFVFNTAS